MCDDCAGGLHEEMLLVAEQKRFDLTGNASKARRSINIVDDAPRRKRKRAGALGHRKGATAVPDDERPAATYVKRPPASSTYLRTSGMNRALTAKPNMAQLILDMREELGLSNLKMATESLVAVMDEIRTEMVEVATLQARIDARKAEAAQLRGP